MFDLRMKTKLWWEADEGDDFRVELSCAGIAPVKRKQKEEKGKNKK